MRRPPSAKIVLSLAAVAFALAPVAHANPPAAANREKIGEVLGKPVYRDELPSNDPDSTEEDDLHRLFLEPVLEKYCAAHKAEVEPTPAELVAAERATEKYFRDKHVRRAAEIRESLQLVDKELLKKNSESKREDLLQKKHDMEKMLKAELAAKLDDDTPSAAQMKMVQAELDNPRLEKADRESLEELKRLYEKERVHPFHGMIALFYPRWKLQRHFYDRFGGGRVLWQQAGYEAFDAYRRWLESEERQGHFKISDPKLRQVFYQYWKKSHTPFLTGDPQRIRREFLQPCWAPLPSGF
jgi:hypothetical protein